MTALAVAFYVACVYLILLAIRDMRRDRRQQRHRRTRFADGTISEVFDDEVVS